MTTNELIKKVENAGWYFVRQNGSHKIFNHDVKPGHLSIPDHGKKDLGKGLVNKILKQAGLK